MLNLLVLLARNATVRVASTPVRDGRTADTAVLVE